jgi:hypothetical protein
VVRTVLPRLGTSRVFSEGSVSNLRTRLLLSYATVVGVMREALSPEAPPASSLQSERRPLTLRGVAFPAWALIHVIALYCVTAARPVRKLQESASRRPRPRDSMVTS